MQTMTPEEYHHFMLQRARTGKLASVREDGSPHIAPIWYDLDGDVVMFTTWTTTVKARNIRRDPRVSLCVDEDAPPFSFVIVEGRAEFVSPPPEKLLYWTTRIAARYMGADLAQAYGKRNAVEGELLLRLTPAKIVARRNIAD